MGVRPTLHARWVSLLVVMTASSAFGGCQFNATWSGRWFQSGIRHLVNVNATTIETKGTCVERSGDKFIMEDRAESPSCFRCIFITANHVNVLQYKETYCMESYDSVDSLCNMISGDAALYLLFRDRAASVEPCPFKGAPFTFTYNRGTGECVGPVSRIDSCIQDSRLRVHYQACPDIPGTESAVEELVCVARWKEGSQRYMVAKISRAVTTSDEDRYRCYVYERTTSADGRTGFNVAQSGDATCSGLQSPSEGSRTMKLTRVESVSGGARCHYPRFVTDHHAWHTLDAASVYHFTQRNATLRETLRGDPRETRVTCHETEYNGEGVVRLVAHATQQCHSGYICMVFHKRDAHVIELQQSNVSVQVPEEACSPDNFQPSHVPFITLVTTSMRPRACPHPGRYSVRTAAAGEEAEEAGECGAARYRRLQAGCEAADSMEFSADCADKLIAYSCHASWEADNVRRVIASPVSRTSVGAARRLCLVYSGGAEGEEGKKRPTALAAYAGGCQGVPEFSLNITQEGECSLSALGAVSASSAAASSLAALALLLLLAAALR